MQATDQTRNQLAEQARNQLSGSIVNQPTHHIHCSQVIIEIRGGICSWRRK